jgi:hypothetical protein
MTRTAFTKTNTGRSTKSTRGMILGGLLATSLAAGLFAAPMASASDTVSKDDKVNSQGWNTSAFKVTNLTGKTLAQTHVWTDFHWEEPSSPPENGYTIAPAEQVHYELATNGHAHSQASIAYQVKDGDTVVGDFYAAIDVNTYGSAFMKCHAKGNIKCETNGYDEVTVKEINPTTITIGPDQRETQAKLMRQYCGHEGVTCRFDHKGDGVDAVADPHVVGAPFYNDRGEGKTTFKLERTDEVTQTDTVGVEVKASDPIFHIFDVSLKYEHGWETKNGTTQGFDVEVEPGGSAWLEVASAVKRFTGTFTIQMGNTTWKLDNAFVDSFIQNSPKTSWHACGTNPGHDHELKNLLPGDHYVCKAHP